MIILIGSFNDRFNPYNKMRYGVPWAGGQGVGFNQANRVGGAVGGWKELARTTLGSAGDNITVSGLADKRYYMVLCYNLQTGGFPQPELQMGNGSIDTGSNYAKRNSNNGGADSALGSQTSIDVSNAVNTTPDFSVGYIANLSGKEKLWIGHSVAQNTAGAGTSPARTESVGKWVNTSNPLDYINYVNTSSGDFNTNSQVVVLGWDPADTHTDNFWEELASVNWSSGGNISSGTFTAKKYLWIQGFLSSTSTTGGYPRIRVGNSTIDTGSNYSGRYSIDGGADSTQVSSADNFWLSAGASEASRKVFFNCFIVNNSANEKLFIGHTVFHTTSGAGTAPRRVEWVMKWANTSNQINIIDVDRSAGDFESPSTIRVWGSD